MHSWRKQTHGNNHSPQHPVPFLRPTPSLTSSAQKPPSTPCTRHS
ncbi:hypothetical protein PITC_008590 [Penicillium italicum]|uniref:Uncharacterized protein n=1 Tax=Penicillium italicum TaxID=40296 RepID=A0A0A2LCK2_PENIT|nr:hypothetical protein PITC_008590 [Penicillium italicum]